ncbi:MAG: Na/Pi cotransporter family protein [Lachnospiraceae bacterium]|nr:Na/Pi cotransporter family protein [Lachnospiraceae bacterium]
MTSDNIISLLGGLALFMFGMTFMSDGLKKLAGDYMRTILEKLTETRIMAVLLGAGLTALIQSSNAMCVMTVGFVNAGMMELERSVGIIMGAKLGTTITGQLIATNYISKYAPVIAFVGVAFLMFAKSSKLQSFGQVVASLGILFVGLTTMSTAMRPLAEEKWFIDIMSNLSFPLLGVIVGVIFTVIIQSASASVGVLQMMALSGVIAFRPAFYVMLGMNIGASIAPILASISGKKDAKRVAAIVAIFETLGMIIFVIVTSFLPVLDWLAMTSSDPSRQIANANTIFNLVSVIILFPFANQIAGLAKRIVRGDDEEPDMAKLEFISETAHTTATAMIGQIDAETKRMQDLVRDNLHLATENYFKNVISDIKPFTKTEETIDFLSKEITDALVRMSSFGDTTPEQIKHVGNLFHVINDLERIGDHAENMAQFSVRMRKSKEHFSKTAMEELRKLINIIDKIFDEAYAQMITPDQDKYAHVYALKRDVNRMIEEMKEKHINRMNKGKCTSQQGMMYVELLMDLERVAAHAMNIAQSAT